MFGFHCRKFGLDITYRCSESLQCILKAPLPTFEIALAFVRLDHVA